MTDYVLPASREERPVTVLGTFGRPRYAWPAGFEPSPTSLEPSATGLESSATGDRQCHGLYLLQRPGSTPLVQYFAVLCR